MEQALILALILTNPLFWLHHDFINKIWADWQALRPSNARYYGDRDEDGIIARLSDEIEPFDYRIDEVLRAQDPCYEHGKVTVT
jgi:tyrosinase